jgi:hypothetical protein
LLHEMVHAGTGFDDISRDFELALTDLLGHISERALHVRTVSKQLKASGKRPKKPKGHARRK